nr:TrmH family RNA methyltransferase [Clostridium sp. DMHC 10]
MNKSKSHVVLVDPSNMGNIGTIIRTMIGFGINNLAVIGHGADLFNPKVVRASMGAIFKLNFTHYDCFEDYIKENSEHDIYPFMLKGAVTLDSLEIKKDKSFSIVFGNEAAGLSDNFLEYGTSVLIPHQKTIDSLNLTIAAGIAIYEFSLKSK